MYTTHHLTYHLLTTDTRHRHLHRHAKFFPIFLLIGYVGYAVQRHRNFQDCLQIIWGRYVEIAHHVGSAVQNPEDPEAQENLFQIYRYLTVALFFTFKGYNPWYKVVSFVDLYTMGLVTDSEIISLEGLSDSRVTSTLLAWVSAVAGGPPSASSAGGAGRCRSCCVKPSVS